MNKAIIFLTLFLAACSMTNDEVIAETKKCKEAGMDVLDFRHPAIGVITKIQCAPKKEGEK